jgi:hypothetical protein
MRFDDELGVEIGVEIGEDDPVGVGVAVGEGTLLDGMLVLEGSLSPPKPAQYVGREAVTDYDY